jgi:hypothetical protein
LLRAGLQILDTVVYSVQLGVELLAKIVELLIDDDPPRTDVSRLVRGKKFRAH